MTDTVAKFSFADPDNVPLTLTVTLPAKEWAAISAALPDNYDAAGRFGKQVGLMVEDSVGHLSKVRGSTAWRTFDVEEGPAQ